MRELPPSDCLIVAAATPFTPDLKPDVGLLAAHCGRLVAAGCDGVAVFGTTGEGAMVAPEDRMRTLEALLAEGLPPGRLIPSVGALAISDAGGALPPRDQARGRGGAAEAALLPPWPGRHRGRHLPLLRGRRRARRRPGPPPPARPFPRHLGRAGDSGRDPSPGRA